MREMLALLLLIISGGCNAMPPYDAVHGATMKLGVPGGSCSGTAVGHYTILTAGHCFYNDKGKTTKPASITANGETCEVWRLVDDGNDHVFLTVSGCKFNHRAKLGLPAKTGDEVFIWGNPMFLDDQLRVGRASGYGYLPSSDESPVLAKRFQFFDISSTYGDSGSAIFNLSGEIVGVLSIGTDPITRPFHLMGALPLTFTFAQWKDAGL